jgi:hypothetical protein
VAVLLVLELQGEQVQMETLIRVVVRVVEIPLDVAVAE